MESALPGFLHLTSKFENKIVPATHIPTSFFFLIGMVFYSSNTEH
jgi:hypothetical protein